MERANEIINMLLSENDYLTTNAIADRLKVSNKTIRNEFNKIEEIINKYNLELDRKPGSGVSIIGNELDIISLKEVVKHIKNIVPYSSEERRNYILNRLFKDNTNLTIRQLATELYVSKSTIHKDLILVSEWLSSFDLTLIKKPNLGIEIEGKEQDWRNAFITLLSSLNNRESKDYVFKDNLNINSRLDGTVLNKLNSISQLDYYIIEKILSEAEEELQYDFSDEAFINLMIHIALSIKRKETKGSSNIAKGLINPIEGKKEYEAAKSIIRKINVYFKVKLPEYEIYYITVHILGSKRYEQIDSSVVTNMENRKEDLSVTIANEIIGIIENYLGIYLQEDKQFKNALIMHLSPTINRIKYGLTLRNPITDDIEENYPEAYGIAWLSNTIFKKYFGKIISREEIGYLALHIAAAIERNRKPLKVLVVCSSGIGTSQLLALKIKRHFSDIQVLDVISALSIKKMDLNGVDLIISTVATNVKIPQVLISPLLSEKDVRKLEIVINSIKNKTPILDKESVINEDFIYINEQYNSKEELIKNICEKLRNRSYINDGFLQSILEREEKYTTEVGNGVAIPHGNFKYVNVPIVVYIKLKKPIMWKEDMVQIVLLVCTREKDTTQFIKFFRNFYKLIESEEEIRRLGNYTDKGIVRECLENIFYEN
ncbi:BglG family transcription antiterminator [Clostridium sp. 'White wine YQ']|uniref:BglG family transcription antiterminator n=1 Tax=Clostridium sp. 'White wine YQ' TaxID=3027474 RepID=UPI002366D8F2|nr:BglG family transcription antiterminator [Clostridium sp. 'White wine YQ']MDD7795004.1 BglG family transcription antiterminator [Clostridium sp. 'White wine YQ']